MYRDFLVGKMPPLPEMHFHLVDVRDVALAHIRAMESTTAAGRYIVAGEFVSDQALRRLLGRYDASIKIPRFRLPRVVLDAVTLYDGVRLKLIGEAPRLTKEALADYAELYQLVSADKARDQLKIDFRSAEDSVSDTLVWMRKFLALGGEKKSNR